MKKNVLILLAVFTLLQAGVSLGSEDHDVHGPVSDQVIGEQRGLLAKNTKGEGFGPQSPRDIDSHWGANRRVFGDAPDYKDMQLCNIHFHKNAEHKGGEFTEYAGNGDGHGYEGGYKYTGKLSEAELEPFKIPGKHGGLSSGDTIEVHYVYTTAQIKPGETLAACLHPSISNPQLRVETQVYVLVNDSSSLDFNVLAKHGKVDNLHQAFNIPNNTGAPVQYSGSTTGPSYNETGSPFHVTWSVRPKVAKVNIETVAKWLKVNTFGEDHAHGVRNLVTNMDLLSKIER